MKKSVCKALGVALLVLLVLLGGCAGRTVSIEGSEWTMSVVQQADDSGTIVACAPAHAALYPDAVCRTLTCTAENGVLTLTDADGAQQWTGTYALVQQTDEPIYEVSLDGESGYGSVSQTTYADGSRSATMILSLGEYVLYFTL